MVVDGLSGPCGIRLGSTAVGTIGMIHLVSTQDKEPAKSGVSLFELDRESLHLDWFIGNSTTWTSMVIASWAEE